MNSDIAGHDDRRKITRRCLGAAALLGCVAMGLVFPFPTEGRLWGALFDLAHAPVFCCVLLLIVGMCDPSTIGFSKNHPVLLRMTVRRVALIVLVLILAGATAEVLQHLVGRSASFADIAANTIGLAAGICWLLYCRCASFRCGIRYLVIGGLLLVFVSVSPARDVWDCVQQIRNFPMLASFERAHEFPNWHTHSAAISQSTEWSTEGQHCAKLQLEADDYPGMLMVWFERDWAGRKAFHVDLKNPGDNNLQVVIKIHDRQHVDNNFADDDRFHETFLIPAKNVKHVRIPIREIRNAPAGRHMDMTKIWTIDIFAIHLQKPAVLLVDGVRLE